MYLTANSKAVSLAMPLRLELSRLVFQMRLDFADDLPFLVGVQPQLARKENR